MDDRDLSRFAPVEDVVEAFNRCVEAEAQVEEAERLLEEARHEERLAQSRLQVAQHTASGAWASMKDLARSPRRRRPQPPSPPEGSNAARTIVGKPPST